MTVESARDPERPIIGDASAGRCYDRFEGIMKYEVHYNDEFFEVTTHGDAEPGGFEEFIDLMLGHEKWKPGTTFLVDLSELNAVPLSEADVRTIAVMCGRRRAQFGRARCALLARRNVEYGLARMWEVYVEGEWDVTEHLFRSRDEAISWLKDF